MGIDCSEPEKQNIMLKQDGVPPANRTLITTVQTSSTNDVFSQKDDELTRLQQASDS